ncbi:MAG: hypothetical protein WBY71_04685 [Nitrososphaeraceae archaeon]
MHYLIKITYNNRYRDAIKIWMPLSAAGALISFLVAFVMHVPLRQMIFAMIFTAALIFSGYIFRSFGRDKGNYKR